MFGPSWDVAALRNGNFLPAIHFASDSLETSMTEPSAPDSYGQFLADLKGRIRAAQLRASLAVNRELVLLYWQIGRDILDRQHREN
jgi:hypothetical protein